MDVKDIKQKNNALFKKYFRSKKLDFKKVNETEDYITISLFANEVKLYRMTNGLVNENSLLTLKLYAPLVFKGVLQKLNEPISKMIGNNLFSAEFAEVPLTREIYVRVYIINVDGSRIPLIALKTATINDSLRLFYKPHQNNETILAEVRNLTTEIRSFLEYDDNFIRENYGPLSFIFANFDFKFRYFLTTKALEDRTPRNSIYSQHHGLKFSKASFEIEKINPPPSREPKEVEVVKKVTFADVYCLDDIVSQFREIGHLITNYKQFTNKGVRLPYGIMLVGEPGTGKTLTMNAFINEYRLKRYDLIQPLPEQYSYQDTVSEIFEKARKNKPAVIVIDEIDKMRLDSTFYQEMSGQVSNDGILVIATANSLSNIHPSLLRPGRFDRKILYRVLNGETKKKMLIKKLDDANVPYDIDIDTIIELMPYSSNAHIDTYINEALIQLTLNNEEVLSDEQLLKAVELVDNGYMTPQTYTSVTKHQIRIHEAGHALIALHYLGPNSIVKIDTNPRASYGGFVQLVKKEGVISDDLSLLNQIRIGLGGIIAERLYSDNVSIGASNDLTRVRDLCEDMIVNYGLVDLQSITASMFHVGAQISTDKAKNSVIEKSRLIISEAEREVSEVLTKYRDVIQKLVALLDKKPVLLKKDIARFYYEEVIQHLN